MSAPQIWPWNRKEVGGIAVTAGTQDYTVALTDFGYLEKAALTDASGNQIEIKYVYNNLPLSSDTTGAGRPNGIAVIDYIPYVSVTFRLLDSPPQDYTLTVTYQKLPQGFATYSVESVTAPAPPLSVSQVVSVHHAPTDPGPFTIPVTVAPLAVGDVVVIWGSLDPSRAVSGASDGNGNTFGNIFNTGSAQYDSQLAYLNAGVVTANPGSTTVTLSINSTDNNGSYVNVFVAVITGGALIDVSANSTSHDGSNPLLVSMTTTVNSGLALLLAVGAAPSTVPADGAMTNTTGITTATITGAGSLNGKLQSATVPTAGAVVGSTPQPSPDTVHNFMIAVKSSGGGGGGNPTYTGTFFVGGFPVGSFIAIDGFVNAGNNGTFQVVSSTDTEVVVINPNSITETASASASNPYWDPIPDSFIDVFNNLFLSEALALVDDARAQIYRVRGVSAFLAKSSGLTETQKNAFVQQWLARSYELAATNGDLQLGMRGRTQ